MMKGSLMEKVLMPAMEGGVTKRFHVAFLRATIMIALLVCRLEVFKLKH